MSVAITSMGMISPVSRGVYESCAAITAGINRQTPLSYFEMLDESHMPVPVLGNCISGYTEGYYFIARWLRMAVEAVNDMIKNTEAVQGGAASWRNVGVICVLPEITSRFNTDRKLDRSFYDSNFLSVLFSLVDAEIECKFSIYIEKDQAGFVQAVDVANRALAESKADRIIILGVDSYVESSSLGWLAKHNRLKTPDNPAGLIPGESCACILLEKSANNSASSDNNSIAITDYSYYLGEKKPIGESVPTGEVLYQALKQCLSKYIPDGKFSGEIIVDLNGEKWRSEMFANARVKLLGDGLELESEIVLPVVSTGETGASIGVVSTCLAQTSLFSSTQKEPVLVITCNDDNNVGVFLVEKH